MINPLLSFVLPSLLSLSGLFFSPSPSMNVPKEEETAETTEEIDPAAGLLTGTGLIATGGAGAAVIYFNNKRKKENVPASELTPEENKNNE